MTSHIANRFSGFRRTGQIRSVALDIDPGVPPPGRTRHRYGDGPFALLSMPELPTHSGLYIWEVDGDVLYLGQTSQSLVRRMGSQGHAVIHRANTLAPEPGRRNGGQRTNCRINALANEVLRRGGVISLWTRETTSSDARDLESQWMAEFCTPPWNRRSEADAPRPRRSQVSRR